MKTPKDPLIASIAGAILTVLGALNIAELLSISGDDLAMIVGALATLATAIRAIHLGAHGSKAVEPPEEGEGE